MFRDKKKKNYMKLKKLLYLIPLILFGIFIFVYGGYDDSPGAQGLGLLFVIFGVVKIIKKQKNK
ncbi:MAG: hypothetical protein PHZ07_02285 [Patescibacteria group bacterium]|nr:hypothetical protein [Patescibacteria group bacterium]MDD4304229.1 hypothetical protein [Patescibacteria group bacterium]MDD4695283.1 hypothetical protein [Patescibacteria group bacterium]